MKLRKMTKAERAEWDAHLDRMLVNALRTRELAEKGQAKLDAAAAAARQGDSS
jgi:hypothetical protein